MKFKISLLLALVFLTGTSSAIAQNDSFLCVADKSVGFSFNKSTKEWESTNFKAEGKYVLSKPSDKAKGWELKEFGSSITDKCAGGFSENGFIYCKGWKDFQMNNKSLRFQIVYAAGYVISEYLDLDDGQHAEGSVTPYLEIGKCSPL